MSAPETSCPIPTVRNINSCGMKCIAAAGLLCIAVATATAQPAKQGQQIAAQGTSQGVAACISCHGAKGEGLGAFPRLAGTGQAYLLAQLDAFAGGSRKNPIMQPIAQNLTPMERQAVALYFSQLPAPFVASDSAQPSPSSTGAWLATRGRWADQVPACAQCHGPGGSGVGAQFPPLAGLPAAYIAEQLQGWKAGNRPPGPLALMSDIAKKLSDAEVSAVASYYEKLAAPGAAVTSGPSVIAEPAKAKGRP
jgi:cytochrome c553